MEKNLLTELKSYQESHSLVSIKRSNGNVIIGFVEKILSQIILIRPQESSSEVSITLSEISSISKYTKSVRNKFDVVKDFLFN